MSYRYIKVSTINAHFRDTCQEDDIYKIKGIMLKKATRPPGIQGDLLVRFIKEGFIREISDLILASIHL